MEEERIGESRKEDREEIRKNGRGEQQRGGESAGEKRPLFLTSAPGRLSQLPKPAENHVFSLSILYAAGRSEGAFCLPGIEGLFKFCDHRS